MNLKLFKIKIQLNQNLSDIETEFLDYNNHEISEVQKKNGLLDKFQEENFEVENKIYDLLIKLKLIYLELIYLILLLQISIFKSS